MTKRRDFIKQSVLGTAGLAVGGSLAFSAKSYASIMGANDRVTVATCGIRGQGRTHISSWCSLKDNRNVRLKTLCDVDEQYYAPIGKMVYEKSGQKPGTEWDMRRVFDDKDIDAVSFAIPNHWHALATIWAVQAGKNVYVEKPCSHNIFEGRKMIEAARKYNKRVQVGFQNRSIKEVMEAMKFLHEGGIGKVYMARGLCIKPRDSFGIAKDSTPPANLHYDMWIGPAAYQPYNEKKTHYNWHWFWNTGNGDTGNQGPHQFDVARWGLNKHEHPVKVVANGGIYRWSPDECAQETPSILNCAFKYEDGTMLEFETRGGASNGESSLDTRIGNVFYGTEGYLELDGSTWKAYRNHEKEPFKGTGLDKGKTSNDPLAPPGGTEHYANFIDAIRSGKSEDLHCDIEQGFYSSALPHLANISYRTGRQLHFDGEKEKFVKDSEADALLTREYRKPFVITDHV